MILDHRVGLEDVGANLAAPLNLLHFALDVRHFLFLGAFTQFQQLRLQHFDTRRAVLHLIALGLASIHQIAPSYTATAYSDKQITAIGDSKYYVHSKTDFSVTVTLDEPIDDLLLLKFHVDNHLGNGTTTGDVAITINGIRNKLTDPQWKYQNNNNNFQYTLSSDKPIQKLKLKFSAGDYVISKPVMYTMEYQVLEDTSAEISPWQLHHDTLGDDTMAGSIQVKQDGCFVLAVPYDTGFHVTVDGKETAYSRTDTDFLGFPITQGEHQISITYTAPLAKAGKYCSAAGIGLTLLFFTGNCWLRRRKQKQHF